MEASAPKHGLVLEPIALNTSAELQPAFVLLAQSKLDALIVHGTPVTVRHGEEIAAFAMEQRLLTYSYDSFGVTAGLLMSYGADVNEIYNRLASLVDKVLRGHKPADIPVEQPTKFSLRINRKTAEAIGIEIPPALLARADEVIE